VGTGACIAIVIAAAAILVFTAGAVRDFVKGERVGSTLKRWLRRVADAFFSVP
jgi:hypothetical protein